VIAFGGSDPAIRTGAPAFRKRGAFSGSRRITLTHCEAT
jgi:hypothetical protein